jgi:hypothetical protein
VKEKIWANLQRIIELFTQKIVVKLSKDKNIGLGSGIWKEPIPNPGSWVKKASDPWLIVFIVEMSKVPRASQPTPSLPSYTQRRRAKRG